MRSLSDGGQAPNRILLSRDPKQDSEAKQIWVAWYNQWAKVQAGATGELAAAYSKLEGCAARLALIHHLVTCIDIDVDDQRDLFPESMRAGIALTEWFANEARRVYAAISETDDEREARRLAEWVSGRGGRVTARELHRGAPTRYRDTESARLALDALAAVGLGHWVEITGGRGRPTLAFELTVERLTASATDDGEE